APLTIFSLFSSCFVSLFTAYSILARMHYSLPSLLTLVSLSCVIAAPRALSASGLFDSRPGALPFHLGASRWCSIAIRMAFSGIPVRVLPLLFSGSYPSRSHVLSPPGRRTLVRSPSLLPGTRRACDSHVLVLSSSRHTHGILVSHVFYLMRRIHRSGTLTADLVLHSAHLLHGSTPCLFRSRRAYLVPRLDIRTFSCLQFTSSYPIRFTFGSRLCPPSPPPPIRSLSNPPSRLSSPHSIS
ncbi:hypothetical protein C8R43DRAFT_1018696, partial [Mycena crocata]